MENKTDPRRYSRISKSTAALMVVCAIFYEVFELLFDWIPLLGQALSFLIDLVALMHFSFWFMLCGVSLVSAKKMFRYWVFQFIELLPIPVVDFGPTIIAVILMIGLTWAEDTVGLRASLKGNLTKNTKGIVKY